MAPGCFAWFEATTGIGGQIRDFIACFYADNGLVGARDADWWVPVTQIGSNTPLEYSSAILRAWDWSVTLARQRQ